MQIHNSTLNFAKENLTVKDMKKYNKIVKNKTTTNKRKNFRNFTQNTGATNTPNKAKGA